MGKDKELLFKILKHEEPIKSEAADKVIVLFSLVAAFTISILSLSHINWPL